MTGLFGGHDPVAITALVMAVPIFLFGLALGIWTKLDKPPREGSFW
nr:hypothetical protein [uncultured Lichenicoccus sp.]